MREQTMRQLIEALSRVEFAEDQLAVAIKDRDHAEQRLIEAQAEIERLKDKFDKLRKEAIDQRRV